MLLYLLALMQISVIDYRLRGLACPVPYELFASVVTRVQYE